MSRRADGPPPKNQSLPAPSTYLNSQSNPHKLLQKACQQGITLWNIARRNAGNTPILHIMYKLMYILDDHVSNIITFNKYNNNNLPPKKLFTRLHEFYCSPELHIKQIPKTKENIYWQIHHSTKTLSTASNTNKFSILEAYDCNEIMKDDNEPSPITTQTTAKPPTNDTSERLWVNDTSVSRLSEVIINQLHIDRQNQANTGELLSTNSQPQYEDPSFQTIPMVNSLQHIRFNLIRCRDTTSDVTTLKLFKSFATILRNIDPDINILPYEKDKTHISPLTNLKQINSIDENKLNSTSDHTTVSNITHSVDTSTLESQCHLIICFNTTHY